MEIKFKNDIKYAVDFNSYLLKNSKSHRRGEKVKIWLPSMALILLITFQDHWKLPLVLYLVYLSMGLISALILSKLIPWISNKTTRSLIKDISGTSEYINPSTIVILTDNEIIEKGASCEVKYQWRSIGKVIVESNYIYIHNKIGLNCIQIPLIAFKSSKDKDDFLNFINKKIYV